MDIFVQYYQTGQAIVLYLLEQILQHADSVNSLVLQKVIGNVMGQAIVLYLSEQILQHVDSVNSLVLQRVIGTGDFPPLMVALVFCHAPHIAKFCNTFGQVPLHCACANNSSIDNVQLLIDVYPEALIKQDHELHTPLHRAIGIYNNSEWNRDEKIWLSVSAKPNAIIKKDKLGFTPLHLACQCPGFFMELIARPEALSIRCNGGWLPLNTYLFKNQFDFDARDYAYKEGIISLFHLYMVHGFLDLLVDLYENVCGSGPGNIPFSERLPIDLKLIAVATDLVKCKHLAQQDWEWMKVVKELIVSSAQNSLEAAVLDVFWLWLQEYWNQICFEIEVCAFIFLWITMSFN